MADIRKPKEPVATPELTVGPDIATDTVCFVILKARAFDVTEDSALSNEGSDIVDDPTQYLSALADDPTFTEVHDFINQLDVDEQVDLVALTWVGREDFSPDEWTDAVAEARDAHNEMTADYLLGMPMLGDFLEAGLNAFDRHCEDFEERVFQ